MQFDDVEAGRFRPDCAADKIVDYLGDVGLVHLTRRIGIRTEGDRRGGNHFPALFRRQFVAAFPAQHLAALAAGMAELHADLCVRPVVDKIDDAFPRLDMFVVPDARIAGRYPSFRRNLRHLGKHQTGPADSPAAQMDKMKIGRRPVQVVGRVHAHRRHDDPVGERQIAQRVGSKHGRYLRRHILVVGCHKRSFRIRRPVKLTRQWSGNNPRREGRWRAGQGRDTLAIFFVGGSACPFLFFGRPAI